MPRYDIQSSLHVRAPSTLWGTNATLLVRALTLIPFPVENRFLRLNFEAALVPRGDEDLFTIDFMGD